MATKRSTKKASKKTSKKKKPAKHDFLKDWKELNKNPPRVGPKDESGTR
jgi:hypothetical protein